MKFHPIPQKSTSLIYSLPQQTITLSKPKIKLPQLYISLTESRGIACRHADWYNGTAQHSISRRLQKTPHKTIKGIS